MTYRRILAPVFLVLQLAAAPLWAQPDTAQSSEAPPASEPDDKSTTPQQAPVPSEPATGGGSSGAGTDSPFDYRSSEQISEDLPVSFPVDI